LANLFKAHGNLRHLALTDEIYWVAHKSYSMHYKVMLSDPSTRWETMASVFFSTLPNLDEFCLGRQVDFKGQVFRRARPIATPTLPSGHPSPQDDDDHHHHAANDDSTPHNPSDNNPAPSNPNQDDANANQAAPPSPDGHDNENPNNAPQTTQIQPIQPLLIRKYLDPHAPNYTLSFPYNPSPRLVFPPARWTGTRCVWWPINGRVPSASDFGQPDEPAGSVPFLTPAPELGIGRGGHAGGGQRYVSVYRCLFALSGVLFLLVGGLYWDLGRRNGWVKMGRWRRWFVFWGLRRFCFVWGWLCM
jgi:hypothetical protein